ncbi:hypothetical protein B9T31_10035 [Acinetobacter sp. ANC 4558]|uniref:ABZJ_00895 family protein n=1 Tax=Acinetobacter sp. ANC 4558 TaxID=1977876 RepID=UPI000A35911A|nr:ABZJ_00895 family protein [Acinetobacter sp. ANC 4558]OTG85919.1 hypothetical protein B9T31_10035 [Acinetobacter sp. ANC 4558]
MQKYLKKFALFYSISLIIICLILIFMIPLTSLTFIAILIFSAFFSASQFVKAEHRLPTKEEKHLLVWGNSAIAIIIECFLAFFLVIINPNAEQILQAAEKIGIFGYAAIMLFLVAVHAAIFFIAYGWIATFSLKRINKA